MITKIEFDLQEYDPIQLRYDLGLSLESLAELLGVTPSATGKWSAKISNPSRTARRLAYVLKMHLGGKANGQ